MVAKGTTPTFTLTFSDENLDLTQAVHVIATFRGAKTVEKSKTDLEISEKSVSVYLTQQETLALSQGDVLIQLNWTYQDGKRSASDIVKYSFSDNLLERIIT